MRKIADRYSLASSKGDGLDSLNQNIAGAGVFNASTRSQIDAWRHIRNAADHGNFAEYNEEDVRRMVDGVRDLLSRELP